MQRIYLDNNATTPMAPEVSAAMLPWLHGNFGNAASVHWFGQRARAAVDSARHSIAELIGATPGEIVLTASGTEADNLAILGVAGSIRGRKGHIITSAIEHPAVLEACRALQERGFGVSIAGVRRDGVVDLGDICDKIRPDTFLISLMHSNNETGVLEPLAEILEVAKPRGILVHTDAVQSVGKVPVDVRRLPVDLLSLSAHKFHGPQGIGALFVRKGIDLTPLVVGGSQERKRRAGTENVAAIVGFGRAAELAMHEMNSTTSQVQTLRDRFESSLLQRIPSICLNGGAANRVPNTTNIGFEGLEGEGLLMALDMEGVAVSLGSACSSGSLEPSHVLKAMGVSAEILKGSLRFSFSKFNSEEEVNQALDAVCRVVDRMRKLAGGESPVNHLPWDVAR